MADWQPISTAPRDGSWFLICNEEDGYDSYGIGRYNPMFWDDYEKVEGDLYRQIKKQIYEWRGFNNMHRATHWMPLPMPPEKS